MLPTFVIGLREGLEAALIVSIISTFLRRNGKSLRGMWIGVSAGVGLSILVGVALQLVERSLPQREQEAMETVIGLVAVFFVTGMVFWMQGHARFLKRDLEEQASEALQSGTTTALVVMAFLAVLREGFESAVFLLATFQGARSAPAAVAGAVLGILAAVLLGVGIYRGGVRLNLQRFFKVTSVFLVFVAAGLVLSAFRTAHEAGWVTFGQQRTVDLSWLAPHGSIRSALVSGVLGIPADPRVVEVLAWACYLVPMLAVVLWPARRRPTVRVAQRLRVAGAGMAVILAAGLFLLVPQPSASVAASAPVQGGGTARIAVSGDTARLSHSGRTVTLHRAGPDRWVGEHAAGDLPDRLTVTQLLDYTGQRVPVGLNVQAAPGPYTATWTDTTKVTATTHDGGLVTARSSGRLLLRLSEGGLTSPRVLTVTAPHWRLDPAYVATTQHQLTEVTATQRDRSLWVAWLPGFLLVVAAALLVQTYRHRPEPERAAAGQPADAVARQLP